MDDTLSIETSTLIKDLHKDFTSISFWIKPNTAPTGKYTFGRLNAFGFNLPISESYFSNPDLLFTLNPSGSNILTSGPQGTGLHLPMMGTLGMQVSNFPKR